MRSQFTFDFSQPTRGRGCTGATPRWHRGEDGGQPCLWGDCLAASPCLTRDRLSAPKRPYPRDPQQSMAKALYQWTAAAHWARAMVSCQQAGSGRGQGHKSNCATSSSVGVLFCFLLFLKTCCLSWGLRRLCFLLLEGALRFGFEVWGHFMSCVSALTPAC